MWVNAHIFDNDSCWETDYKLNISRRDKIEGCIGQDEYAYTSNEIEKLKNGNTDPNLCYQIALAEYEHSIKRSERLDNKIYILLTVCAFIFTNIISYIGKIREIRYPQSNCEWIISTLYILAIVIAMILIMIVLGLLIDSLKSIDIHRFDSALVMERDMTLVSITHVVRYVVPKYEEARAYNNSLVEQRYIKVNKSVKLLKFTVFIIIFISFISNFLSNINV